MPHQHWDMAFDQNGIELLESAFAQACRCVESDRQLASLGTPYTQRLIARHIIVLAGGGERSPSRLAEAAIAHLRQRERTRRSLNVVATRSAISKRRRRLAGLGFEAGEPYSAALL